MNGSSGLSDFIKSWRLADVVLLATIVGVGYVDHYRLRQLESDHARLVIVADAISNKFVTHEISQASETARRNQQIEDMQRRLAEVEVRLGLVESYRRAMRP